MDISEIKQLTELFAALDIQSFKLTKGDFVVEMKKENLNAVSYSDTVAELPRPVVVAPVAAAATPAEPPAAVVEAPVVEECTRSIKSPLVGTFYASPSPDHSPFVAVGQHVKKGQVVCIVEAMKVMNEIHADADGEIAEVCVEDGTLVEFGTPLFKLR